jgi:hypothetical protein
MLMTQGLMRLKLPIQDLVEEILNQLPASVWQDPGIMFLDPAMAGGQFIRAIERRLLAAGHSKDNIASRVYGCEEKLIRVKYVKNWHKVLSDQLHVMEFLTHDWGDMKFDVIVGNPPYQNGNEKGGKSSLWRRFVSRAWDLVATNGYMAMVVPKLPNDADDLGHIFVENQTTHVWTDVSSHFQGVGSTFTSWIVANRPSTDSTLFVQEGQSIKLSAEKLPKNINAISIIQKFNSWNSKINVTSSRQYKHTSVADGKDDDYLSSRKTTKLAFKMRRTNSDNMYMWGAAEPDDYNKTKVTMTYSGYPGFTYHSKQDPVGTIGFMSGHVLVKNKAEAESLISLYDSKAYKFVRDQISSGGMRGQKIYEQPLLPLTKVWTNEEVYQALGLDEQEVDLIESTIK